MSLNKMDERTKRHGMKSKLLKLLAVPILTLGALTNTSCDHIENTLDPLNQTPEAAVERIEKGQDLIVAIEGAFISGYVMHNRSAELADMFEWAQSAGKAHYSRHLDLAEKTKEEGGQIYSIGLSWGCGRLVDFAEGCQKRGVDIDLLIFEDPMYLSGMAPKKIPDNVKYVLNYLSDPTMTDKGLRGREITPEDFEDPTTPYENVTIHGTEHKTLAINPGLRERMPKDIRRVLHQNDE
jgi:hypothetical protein